MIVPMKKVLLLALKSDQDPVLQELRELGVMDVVSETLTDTADRTAQSVRLNELDRVISSLNSRKVDDDDEKTIPETDDLAGYALQLWRDYEDASVKLESLCKERDELSAWGEYDPGKITALQQQGICVYLCKSSDDQFKAVVEMLPEDAIAEKIAAGHGICHFAVVSMHELSDIDLPAVQIGTRPLSAVQHDIEVVEAALHDLDEKFDALHGELKELKLVRARLANEIELLSVRDGLSDCGEIIALRGFVPVPEQAKLQKAADQNAWAVIFSNPEAGEAVPILLEPPKWVKPILPLFQFLGIAPGYDEFDMSPGMLIFFSIFFSMIINDGGYAVLMFLASVIASIALRKNRKAAMPCRLALILSLCATVWGVCNGAYFGTETAWMQVGFFASGASQTSHLQLVCFILALVHLSLGHCWRLVNTSGVREAIGQLGWVPILFLDFMVVLSLLVFPGMVIPPWAFMVGGAGLLMVVIGGVDWRDVVAICNFPFDLIGSFTDTLSYVRLFAVGMSGTYMAQSFNNMGMELWHANVWLIPVAILVIVFGHTLNVALAFMSVLVHGVRLNTLEFSNHAGIRWGGQAYKPLKKI